MKYFLEWLYWKLIYQRVIAHKIYNLPRPKFENPDLPILLAEWRKLSSKYDGAEYDEKGWRIK